MRVKSRTLQILLDILFDLLVRKLESYEIWLQLQSIAIVSSIFTTVVLALERCLAVAKPIEYHNAVQVVLKIINAKNLQSFGTFNFSRAQIPGDGWWVTLCQSSSSLGSSTFQSALKLLLLSRPNKRKGNWSFIWVVSNSKKQNDRPYMLKFDISNLRLLQVCKLSIFLITMSQIKIKILSRRENIYSRTGNGKNQREKTKKYKKTCSNFQGDIEKFDMIFRKLMQNYETQLEMNKQDVKWKPHHIFACLKK